MIKAQQEDQVVGDARLVQGCCLCPAERERQPGVGQPSGLGIGIWELEGWDSPEHSAAAAHLGCGSWIWRGIAVNPGEARVICALPFLLPPLRVSHVYRDFLSWMSSQGLAGAPG